jgi:phosphatidylglycerol:prolipoprotein diacylglycerol transferase
MVTRGWTTDYYLSHWLEVIFFAQGGFGFLGAIAGLCIGIFLVNWRKSTGFWTWMDCLTPPILASMVIGRWADAFNNILYGQPTLNTQWAVYIEPEFRLVGFEQFDYFQPLFLYESLGAFLLLILILFIERDQKWDWLGRTAMIGLGGYAGLRFFLEYLRIDISLIGTKNINQLIAGWLFVGASVVVLRNLFVLRQLSAYQRLHR